MRAEALTTTWLVICDFADYRAAARATTRQAFRRINEEAIGFRLPPGAAGSPCSVLAVAGGNEHELTRRSVATIAAAFPHGRGRLVTGVGHAWNGELPGVFSDDPLPGTRRRATG